MVVKVAVLNRVLRTLRVILRIHLRIHKEAPSLLDHPLRLPKIIVLRKRSNNHRHLRKTHNLNLILRKRRIILRSSLKGSRRRMKTKVVILRKNRRHSILMNLRKSLITLMTILLGMILIKFLKLPSS
jgi:hypothetical protein